MFFVQGSIIEALGKIIYTLYVKPSFAYFIAHPFTSLTTLAGPTHYQKRLLRFCFVELHLLTLLLLLLAWYKDTTAWLALRFWIFHRTPCANPSVSWTLARILIQPESPL